MQTRIKRLGSNIWQARYIYLLLIPAILYFGIFHYGPMGGLLMAFKKYNARLGILGSPWVGFDHFRRIFVTPEAISAISNTFVINFSRLVFQFPMPIILAIFINEMRGTRMKRIYQTIYTFPHFLSWVVVSTILINFFSNGGAINAIIAGSGGERINFLSNRDLFRPLLYITANWKESGWGAIVYIAAITGIDPSLYEAAIVDGASRIRRMWHITLPGIRPTIVVMFILAIGRIMNSGFEQIFYMQNAAVKPVSDILDTYIYRITFQATPNYGFSTAVGLFKSVVNLILILLSNSVVKKINGSGLFN